MLNGTSIMTLDSKILIVRENLKKRKEDQLVLKMEKNLNQKTSRKKLHGKVLTNNKSLSINQIR